MHAFVAAVVILIVCQIVSAGMFGFCESTVAFAQDSQFTEKSDVADEVDTNYLNPPLLEPADSSGTPLKPGDALPGLRQFVKSDFDSGKVILVMIGAASLLLLVTPGVVLFNCGIQRTPNVSKIMNHYLILMAVMSLTWVLWIYSLAFARNVGSSDVSQGEILAPDLEDYDGNPYIGGTNHIALQGLESRLGNEGPQYPVRKPSDGIPHLLHMVFHLMFFISVPAPLIVCLVERLRISGTSFFIVLWGTIVFAPVTYWIWGGGWLSPSLDASGAIPAHVCVGYSALGAALILGRRHADEKDLQCPQNSIHLGLGTILFWGGMLLYNSSKTFDAGGISVNAFVTTHLAACTGLIGWSGMEWLRRGKTSLEGVCAGAITGLITLASGNSYVAPQSAMVMGVVGAVSAYGVFTFLNRRFSDNEFLKIFALYAIPGVVGVLLTGIFATTSVGGFDSKGNEITGLLGGNTELLTWQIWAICSATLLSLIGTAIILFAIQKGTKFLERHDESGKKTG